MGPQAATAKALQNDKLSSHMSLSERADHLEEHMMHELDRVITKSVFCQPGFGVLVM